MRKRISLLLALALCLVLLAGCGSQPSVDYPVLEAVDTTSMDLESTSNSVIKVSFPADSWVAQPNSDPLVVYYSEISDYSVNINAQITSEYEGPLNETDKDSLVETLTEESPFINITKVQIMSLNGAPVIYLEETVSITDETIDWMLENGAWTEAWVEQMGGREAFLSLPDSQQMMLYHIVDGQLCLYIGSYQDDSQKSTVLDTLIVMAETTEILK